MSCCDFTSDSFNRLDGLARCLANLNVYFALKPLASLCREKREGERKGDMERERRKWGREENQNREREIREVEE